MTHKVLNKHKAKSIYIYIYVCVCVCVCVVWFVGVCVYMCISIMMYMLHIFNTFYIRLQSINCLVRISFARKNGMGEQACGSKKVQFFLKNIYILPVSCLTCSAK